ncbi:MAG: methyltransferase domain-containing protein [Candidatus Bathyarchaeia archaeon]
MRTKREDFLSEIYENILMPYELSEGYEEDVVGEFENKLEELYFSVFASLVKPKAHILDMACGDGRHTLKLSEHAEHVIAFDISSKNLRKAKRRCMRKGNVSYVKGSMLKSPFIQKSFNGIWFSQAFEYIPPDQRETFLQQLNPILKTDGIVFMSVETWMDQSILASLKEFLSDFKLFCYWKIRRKPLFWGEFLYYCTPRGSCGKFSGWHYHVHTDKYTLCRLLDKHGFSVRAMDISDGYIYLLIEKSKSNLFN